MGVWSCCSSGDEDSCYLECYTVLIGEYLMMFLMIWLSHSLRSEFL